MFSADVRILVRPVIEAALKQLSARTEALNDPERKFDLFDSATLLKLKKKFENEPKLFEKFIKDLIKMSKAGQ